MVFRKFPVILLILVFAACSKNPQERAFYYWKTRFQLSGNDSQNLTSLEIKKLYIRLFDVDWDNARNEAVPKGKIQFISDLPESITFIPVVFITNKTFVNTPASNIKHLSEIINRQVEFISKHNTIPFTEIQFDCDWTESTRLKYFEFLNHFRQLVKPGNITLSATIRLHQIKYYKITGIPPVDKGMLMFYNMGKIDTVPANNSIFNIQDASKYVTYIKEYPLSLDAVLPAFSWGIHIRNGKIIGLLNNLSSTDFKNCANFEETQPQLYQSRKSFFYKGYYFMENDRVKVEETTPEDCKQAAALLAENMNHPSTVALYHLDSINLTRYEKNDFSEIFNSFR